MIQFEGETGGWALPVVLLHWLTGLLALAVALLAVFLLSPPDWSQAYIDRYMRWIGWHRLGGLTVLFLAAGWIAVRRQRPRPRRVGGPLMRGSARTVQAGLLALLVILPTSGYLADSLANPRLELAGGWSLPSLLGPNERLGIAFSYLHKWGGFVLLGLVAVHMAAALWHASRSGDDTLQAMLPKPRKRKLRP